MLAVGSLLPLLNAFMCQRADASADGYSVFVKGPDHTFEQAVARMGSSGACGPCGPGDAVGGRLEGPS